MSERNAVTRRLKTVSLGGVLMQLLPGALLCGLFAAVGVMHVTSRVLVVDAGYSLSKIEAETRELARENDSLRVQLATLQSPGRLEKLAREKLQMAAPAAGSVITLREGSERLVASPVSRAPSSALVAQGRRSDAR